MVSPVSNNNNNIVNQLIFLPIQSTAKPAAETAIAQSDMHLAIPMVNVLDSKKVVIYTPSIQEKVCAGFLQGSVFGVFFRPIDNYLILRQGKNAAPWTIVTELNQQGIRKGWFGGISQSVVKNNMSFLTQFLVKSFVAERLENVSEHKLLTETASGIIAGTAQSLVTGPIATIEAKRATNPAFNAKSLVIDAFTGEVTKIKNASKGICFFYRGTVSTVARNASWCGAFYPIRHVLDQQIVYTKESRLLQNGVEYKAIRSEQLKLNQTEIALVGGIAGFGATIISMPLEVLTKIQRVESVSFCTAFANAVKAGPTRLFKGIGVAGPRMLLMGGMISLTESAARKVIELAYGEAKAAPIK